MTIYNRCRYEYEVKDFWNVKILTRHSKDVMFHGKKFTDN